MGEVERYPDGTFCWVELRTADPESAKAFYEALQGWPFEDEGADGARLSVCRVNGREVAGLQAVSAGAGRRGEGAPAGWLLYVATSDVERVVDEASALGATVLEEPADRGDGARAAVLRDPVGAVFGVWQADSRIGARLVNEPGSWTWNDLATSDPDRAREFYTRLFGWEPEVMAEGAYTGLSRGPLLIGGIMRLSAANAHLPSHWLPYFVVTDAEHAARRVGELGGELIVPVRDVPAGRYAVMRDPSGTPSAIFEMGPEGPSRGVDGS